MVYHVTHGCLDAMQQDVRFAAMSDMVNHRVFDDSFYDLLLSDVRVLQDPFDSSQLLQYHLDMMRVRASRFSIRGLHNRFT